MPINFPANPAANQTYAFNGRSWTFDGTVWRKNVQASLGYTGSQGANGANGAVGFTGSVGFVGSAGSNASANIALVSDQPNTSTGYLSLPQGNTAQRPGSPTEGSLRYNTTTGFAEVYTSLGWGSFGVTPPVITSVSPVTYNGEQGTVISINGTSFTADAIVRFIDTAGAEFVSPAVSFFNSSTLAATTPKDFTVADGPLDVKVVQTSGSSTLFNALATGGTPVWTTASGTLATYYFPGDTDYNITLVATDPDANATVSYSVTTGSLPGNAVLNSNGTITGNIANPGAASNTTTFSVTPTDNAGNQGSPRSFSIVRLWQDGGSSAAAATSASAIYSLSASYQTAAANGIYWIKLPGQATARQVFCLMDSRANNGGWMAMFHRGASTSVSFVFKDLIYSNFNWTNRTYTHDSTNFPVLPDNISFNAQGFTKHLVDNRHPNWQTNKGHYQWFDLPTSLAWTTGFTANNLNTSSGVAGTTVLYGQSQAWGGGADGLSSGYAWWADAGNGGLCGGASQCGTTACPNTNENSNPCHFNRTYTQVYYVK